MPETVSAQEGTVEIMGREYAYKMWGKSQQPVILAFHGWMDNANSFDEVAPELAFMYHVIAFDFLGHGKSAWLPEGCFYHFPELLADASELLARWAANGPVIVMGHSLGGAVATCLAAMHPEEVRACVTIDALGPLTTENDQLVEKLAYAARYRQRWGRRAMRVFPDFESAVQVRQMGELAIAPDAARRLCERGVKPVEGGWSWCSDPRWRSPSLIRFSEAQVRIFLHNVRCPLLLAIGETGLLNEWRVLNERIACLQDVTERRFHGGHHLHMESEASQFVQWVLEVLASRFQSAF